VNGQFTGGGRTHQAAFREGPAARREQFAGKDFAGEDVRDGLGRLVAVKIRDRSSVQTKNSSARPTSSRGSPRE
jgi:hypothetical protein